jgi:hypothetical protein
MPGPGAEVSWSAPAGAGAGGAVSPSPVGFVRVGPTWLVFLPVGAQNGFVRQFLAQGVEAFELLHLPAVLAFGPGLVAQEEGPGMGRG